MEKKDLTKLSYEELEKEGDIVLKKLQEGKLPLDEASAMYVYGKAISAEMSKRLDQLSKQVTDTVENA